MPSQPTAIDRGQLEHRLAELTQRLRQGQQQEVQLANTLENVRQANLALLGATQMLQEILQPPTNGAGSADTAAGDGLEPG